MAKKKIKKKTRAQLFNEIHNKRIMELGGELNKSNSNQLEKVDLKISEEYGEINREMEKYNKQQRKNARNAIIAPLVSFGGIVGLAALSFYVFGAFAAALPILMPIIAASALAITVLFTGLVFPGHWRKWRSAKLGKGEIKGSYNDVKNLNTFCKQVTTAVNTDEEFKKNWDSSQNLTTVKKQKAPSKTDELSSENLLAEIDTMRRQNEYFAQLSANLPKDVEEESITMNQQQEQMVRDMIAENQQRINEKEQEEQIQEEAEEEIKEIAKEEIIESVDEFLTDGEKKYYSTVNSDLAEQERYSIFSNSSNEKVEYNTDIDRPKDESRYDTVNFDLAEQERYSIFSNSSNEKVEYNININNQKDESHYYDVFSSFYPASIKKNINHISKDSIKNSNNKFVFKLSFKITDRRKKGPLVSKILNIKVNDVDKYIEKLETTNFETNKMKTFKNLVGNQNSKLFKFVMIAEVTNPENTNEVLKVEYKDLGTYMDFVTSTKDALIKNFKSNSQSKVAFANYEDDEFVK